MRQSLYTETLYSVQDAVGGSGKRCEEVSERQMGCKQWVRYAGG